MSTLDIFQKMPSGATQWVCGVESIQEAKARLLELRESEPAEYYVCDLAEKAVVVAITRDQPDLHTLPDDGEFFGRAESSQSEASRSSASTLVTAEPRNASSGALPGSILLT